MSEQLPATKGVDEARSERLCGKRLEVTVSKVRRFSEEATGADMGTSSEDTTKSSDWRVRTVEILNAASS
jgi:hypothetical protein